MKNSGTTIKTIYINKSKKERVAMAIEASDRMFDIEENKTKPSDTFKALLTKNLKALKVFDESKSKLDE